MTEPIPPIGGQPTPGAPPANWYTDPGNPGYLRYWDGVQWTGNITPIVGQAVAMASSDPLDVPGGRQFVGFFRAIALGFKQYAKFSGRSSRSEYWWWYLFYGLVGIAVVTPGLILFISNVVNDVQRYNDCMDASGTLGDSTNCSVQTSLPGLFWLGLLVLLVVFFVPTLALVVRRLHDSGKSGWWYFMSWIPFAGGIILIVLMVLDTQPFPNQYGTPPRKGKPTQGTTVPSS